MKRKKMNLLSRCHKTQFSHPYFHFSCAFFETAISDSNSFFLRFQIFFQEIMNAVEGLLLNIFYIWKKVTSCSDRRFFFFTRRIYFSCRSRKNKMIGYSREQGLN